MQQLTFAPNFSAWQKVARRVLADGIPPDKIAWEELGDAQPSLGMFAEEENGGGEDEKEVVRLRVPRDFVERAQRVSCHRDPRRWTLLYRVLWRLTHGEPHLLEVTVDGDVHELTRLDQAVRRDVHKMRAFVRFRAAEHQGATWYVAWFEPEHHIVERNAPFFRDRFAGLRWSILTPDRCVHWDGANLSFTVGVAKSEAPTEDAVERLWVNYYSSIFNPARVKTHAMQAEMPKRYWKNLPEASVIPSLLEEAPHRVREMIAHSRAKSEAAPRAAEDADEWHPAPAPKTTDLAKLRAAAAKCEACPLYKNATQTVFGEGARAAKLVLVGEQPGDQEDRAGHPFVGPAGQLLDRALEEAGIDRKAAYVTNAVKHFKWEPRGKRRLHQKPGARDMAACKPWLLAELHAIEPEVLVLLGSTAAQTIFGAQIRVLRDRGEIMKSDYCERTLITVHPSSLLRAPDEESREKNYREFVADLKKVARLLRER